MAPTPQLSMTVDTATLEDLSLLQCWSRWVPGEGMPCVVGGDRPQQAFVEGRLRVISAFDQGEKVGLSLVAAPGAGPRVTAWRVRNVHDVPAMECLLWVALAITPSQRGTGLAVALAHRTLQMGITTGYPFVVAMFPIHDSRIAALLTGVGFESATPANSDRDAGCAYLRHIPVRGETERLRA